MFALSSLVIVKTGRTVCTLVSDVVQLLGTNRDLTGADRNGLDQFAPSFRADSGENPVLRFPSGELTCDVMIVRDRVGSYELADRYGAYPQWSKADRVGGDAVVTDSAHDSLALRPTTRSRDANGRRRTPWRCIRSRARRTGRVASGRRTADNARGHRAAFRDSARRSTAWASALLELVDLAVGGGRVRSFGRDREQPATRPVPHTTTP